MRNRFSRLLHVYGVSMDFLSLNAVCLAARYLGEESSNWNSPKVSFLWIWLNAAWLIAAWFSSLYAESVLASFETFGRRSLQTFLYWLALVLGYIYFTRLVEIPALLLTAVLCGHGLTLLLNRFLFLLACRFLRQKSLLTRNVLILGYNETAKKLATYLEEEDSLTRVVGYCDEKENVRELSHYPVLAGMDDVLHVSLKHEVSEIYTTIAPEQNRQVYHIIKQAEQACIRVRFIPNLGVFINRSFHVQYLKDLPVLDLRREPLQDGTNQLKKRALDIVVSVLVIIFVLSWLVPFLSLLIWMESPGPVFFKQLRSGRNNKPFWCLKFRSMKVNKDANAKQATRNDNRITKTGRFIRKTSLDEFPQFINVLLGEMSLVGPRPHMLKHTDDYSKQLDDFMVRHFVKPGITGWAQVNGFRGETKTLADMQGRIEHDLWYLENWSLWLDLKILFLTAYNMVRGEKNAF